MTKEDYPSPLTSPGCDLRDFAFMPLDVVRLRDSDLAALESPEACWAAVLLWCASWHQVPAASLPDDDRILASLAGFGRVVREWKRVREGALRGWVKCSDGRLYHPVVAEKANESWKRKQEQSWNTECARIKKLNQRHQTNYPYPSFDDFASPDYSPIKHTTVPEVSPGTLTNCPQGQPPPVPEMSPGKQHPIDRERDRDRDRDNLKPVVLVSGSETQPSQDRALNSAGNVCKALREIGLAQVNPSHPTLTALVDAGATVQEFLDAALEQKSKPDGKFSFSYVIGAVKGRREDAAKLVLHHGTLPNKQQAIEDRNHAATAGWKPPEMRGAGT